MAPEEKTPKAAVAEGSKPESKSETAAPEQTETTSKTPTIIAGILVVAAVLLLVGGAYLYGRGESENAPSSSPSSLSVTPQTAPVPTAQTTTAQTSPTQQPASASNPTPKAADQTKATIVDALYARDTTALKPYLADMVTFTRNATSYFAQKSQSEAATSIMETLYDDPSWNFDQSKQLNAQIRAEEQGAASDILVGTSTQNVIILRFGSSSKVTSVTTALVQEFTAQ